MSGTKTVSDIAIPNADFQGADSADGKSSGLVFDWFVVQPSKSNPSAGETIRVTVYHKNVCGTLTGTNNDNKNQSPGTISITSIISTPSAYLTSYPSDIDMSSGKAEFDLTLRSDLSSGASFNINVAYGTMTTGTTTISIP